MKTIGFRFWSIGILLVASCVLTGSSAEATDTNFWISLSSGRWDTGANWSFSIPPSTNSQSYSDITNGFGPSQTSKIITIDSTTALGTMSISNLLLSAPIANNGTQNVQGQNTLLVSNAASTIFRILNTLTMTTGGSISITNSTVLVDGTNVIIAAYIDGNIWLNTGTFMVTNKIMELGYLAQGTLTVSNGTTDIGALEIGENPGSVGTLTVAGGANALDGYMLVGNFPGATGTVWMTGGSMLATGSVTRVGNAGPGQMIVSNGAWASQGLEVGSFAGGNGTLTLVAGSVAAKGPFIVGGGTGTVVVGSFAELAITNLPTASFTGLGFFICDGSALVTNGGSLLATNAFTLLGAHGSGSLTNSGGIVRLQELSIGLLAGSSGTFTMLGGTTTVSAGTLVGNAINATGTVWMSGGQFTGPMTVGSAGIGRVAMSNGTMNVSNLVVGLTGVGTFTMAGGTNLPQIVNIGSSSSTGQLWITGGQIGSNGVDYTVGAGNVGGFTVSNGVALGRNMIVGSAAGSRGTVSVSGGTVAMTGPLMVGGNGGTGLVQVTGGQLVLTNTPTLVGVGTGLVVDTSLVLSNGGSLIVTNVSAVIGNFGDGVLSNVGGTFSAPNIIVGNFAGSHGSINMSGGRIGSAGTLTLGGAADSSGKLWMSGGDLQCNQNPASRINIGGTGYGALTVSNGTMETFQVIIGFSPGSAGELTIAGGTYTSGSAMSVGYASTGAVWVTSGVLAQTNSSRTASISTDDGTSTITVSNGLLVADSVLLESLSIVGHGTLTAAGGTTIINTNLVIGKASCAVTLGGQGYLVVDGGNVFVTNASHTAVLDVNNGVLELDSGTLVIDKLVMTNSCAQFVRTGGTLIYGSAVLNPNDDTDGDGIPNGYEQSHGLDPLNPADASADNDGDGFSNLQEYLAGTDPNNSASAFRITSISQTGNNVLVTWMMGPGKTNALQVTSGVGGGAYATNSFTNLFIVTNTVGTTTNFLDVGGATNSPARYYRVRLVP
jgi:T5SS/PEP-CTERM-associated repeat protein